MVIRIGGPINGSKPLAIGSIVYKSTNLGLFSVASKLPSYHFQYRFVIVIYSRIMKNCIVNPINFINLNT